MLSATRTTLLLVLLAVTVVCIFGAKMSGRQTPRASWDHSRPTRLSDPHDDNGEQVCRQLLATPDDELGWQDFQILFGPLPAGTFDELLYFVPLALRHARERREGYGEYLQSLVQWLSSNESSLAASEREAVVGELAALLGAWTTAFEVKHFDETACQAKGWALPYLDAVECSEAVADLVYALVKGETLAHVAESFVAELSESKSPREAAWFLEVARWQEEGLTSRVTGDPIQLDGEDGLRELLSSATLEGVGDLDVDGVLDAAATDAVRSERILTAVRDRGLRARAIDVVAKSGVFDLSSSYWRGVLRSLDLNPLK